MIFISHKLHEVKAVADRVTGAARRADDRDADDGRRELARAGRADGRARGRARPQDRAGGAARRRLGARARGPERARRPRRAGGEGRLAVRAEGRDRRRRRAWRATGSASWPRRSPACGRRATGRCTSPAGSCGPGDPRAAIAAGVAHVPEDRLGTGVAPSLSISENSVLKSYRGRAISRGPLLRWRAIREHARRPDPALRRVDAWAAPAGARPLRRQPAEARARPRVLRRAEGADRRLADARARRRARSRPCTPTSGRRPRTASPCC